MSNVDWGSAPRDAEFFANGHFRKRVTGTKNPQKWILTGWTSGSWSLNECVNSLDYQPRPQQWPETDERIDRIGRDRTEDDLGHYNRNSDEVFGRDIGVYTTPSAPERTTSDELRQPVSAADFLSEGLKTLSERGKTYDPNGKKELSFNQVAEAFNAVTGKAISGADVCLMLVMLKIVRQNATEGFHLDSAVDGVNYMALWAELLNSSDQLK